MELSNYPDILAKMYQIKEGKIMLEEAVNVATNEMFSEVKQFKTYWELYSFIKMVSSTNEEFNIQMQIAREEFLRR